MEIEWKPGSSKLSVYVDCQEGVTLEACQKLSRHLEGFLDSENILGDKYNLEVSSPGLDRPLIDKRQFEKNIGRIIRLELKDGKNLVGKLLKINDPGSLLIQEEVLKGKKKTPHLGKEKTVDLDQVEKTFVEVRFK